MMRSRGRLVWEQVIKAALCLVLVSTGCSDESAGGPAQIEPEDSVTARLFPPPLFDPVDADTLSDQQLFQAIAHDGAPWAVETLVSRSSTYDTVQLQALLESYLDLGVTISTEHPFLHEYAAAGDRVFPSHRGLVFDDPAESAGHALRVRRYYVTQALYTGLRDAIHDTEMHTTENAGHYHQLYLDMEDMTKYPTVPRSVMCGLETSRRTLQDMVLEFLSAAGEPGLEKLRILGRPSAELAAPLARLGRPEDVAELVDITEQQDDPEALITCLRAFALLGPGQHTSDTQKLLRKKLPPFFTHEKEHVRQMAAYVARKSLDPYFLPKLEDLAQAEKSGNLFRE